MDEEEEDEDEQRKKRGCGQGEGVQDFKTQDTLQLSALSEPRRVWK